MKAGKLIPIAALIALGLAACSSSQSPDMERDSSIDTKTSSTASDQPAAKESRAKASARAETRTAGSSCRMIRGDNATHGRNVRYRCNGRAVLASAEARAQLDPSVPVSFGGGGIAVRRNLVARQSANAPGRITDEAACERALINAAKRFQDTAKKSGATRVTNFHSYFDRQVQRGGTYDCEAGTMFARVIMRGDIAR